MYRVYQNIIEKATMDQNDFHGVVTIADLGNDRAEYANGLAERVLKSRLIRIRGLELPLAPRGLQPLGSCNLLKKGGFNWIRR